MGVQLPKDNDYLPTFVNPDLLTRHIERSYIRRLTELPTEEEQRVAWQHAFVVDLPFPDRYETPNW